MSSLSLPLGDLAQSAARDFARSAVVGLGFGTGLACIYLLVARTQHVRLPELDGIAHALQEVADAIRSSGSVRAGLYEDEDGDIFVMSSDQPFGADLGAPAPASAPAAREIAAGDGDLAVFERIDRLRDEREYEQACRLIAELEPTHSTEFEFVWRLGRSKFDLAEKNRNRREELLNEGLAIIERAMAMNDCNANVHKWKAILAGALAEFKPLKEKVESGFIFRRHIERAIELNPDDPFSHHLLGRWCFEVAKLSWWEKRACAAFVAAPPEATYDETLEHLLRGENLSPGFYRSNRIFIGKAYEQLGDMDKARDWFRQALQLPSQTEEDRKLEEEVMSKL